MCEWMSNCCADIAEMSWKMLPDGERLIRVISTAESSILGVWRSFGGPVTFKILLDARPCDPPPEDSYEAFRHSQAHQFTHAATFTHG